MQPIAPVSPPRDRVEIIADLVAARAALDGFLRDAPNAATQTRIHRLHYQIAALECEYRAALGLPENALIFV